MRTLLALLAANIAVVQVAEARETGDIRGEVTDTDGLGVPNAEVVLSGEELAGERRITSDGEGGFRFDFLLPGTYLVQIYWDGVLKASAKVDVNAEVSTWLPVRIDLTSNVEVVDIVYVKPVIDSTSSSISHSLGQGYLQNLPVGRSYQDVVQTLPGVYGRVDTSSGGEGDGNPSVRGEGQYGNNYTFDGVSTRDPATNTFSQNLPFDAIQEIQVYTDGAPAEFGQFTGMAVNVVTKDGGDEHHGSAAIFYSQHAYSTKERFRKLFDADTASEVLFASGKSWSPSLNITAGGPIVKEKLWYFAAADLDVGVFQGRQRCDGFEDDLEGCRDFITSDAKKQEARDGQLEQFAGMAMTKFTWYPTDDFVLRYFFKGDFAPQPQENLGDPLVAPEADTDRLDWAVFHLLTATWLPDEKSELVFRAGYNQSSIDVVPHSGDRLLPNTLSSGGASANNADSFDFNDRTRVGGGFTFQRRFDKAAGTHTLKLGAEYWYLSQLRDLEWTGQDTNGDGVIDDNDRVEWIDQNGDLTGELVQVGSSYQGFDSNPADDIPPEYPCVQPDGSDCYTREYRTIAGPLGTKSHTFSAFIQDDWTPVKSLTFNVGVRMDLEDGRNDVGKRPTAQLVEEFALPPEERTTCPEGEPQGPCTLGPLVMVAPRVGFAWDITNDNKTKLAAFYGWFYDLMGSDFWEWSNTRSANGFIRSTRNEEGNWSWTNTQDPEGTPLIYDKKAHPAKQEMVVLGFERELVDLLALKVRGIYRRTNGMLEDVDVDYNNWYIMNAPLKQRFYRGLEITLEKRWDDVWQAMASYTLAESWGHMPGQFESESGSDGGSNGNNVGVYLDEIGERATREQFYQNGFGGFLEGFKGNGRYSVTDPTFSDDGGYLGYLPYHSFHSLKLNGSYKMPWGTELGVVYEFDSGHAWQKRTFVPFYGYNGFAQGRGTRFMPAVHWLDVRVGHLFEFGKERSLELTLDVFNLPGFFKPITYYENDAPGFGLVMFRQSPRSVRAGVKFRW